MDFEDLDSGINMRVSFSALLLTFLGPTCVSIAHAHMHTHTGECVFEITL